MTSYGSLSNRSAFERVRAIDAAGHAPETLTGRVFKAINELSKTLIIAGVDFYGICLAADFGHFIA